MKEAIAWLDPARYARSGLHDKGFTYNVHLMSCPKPVKQTRYPNSELLLGLGSGSEHTANSSEYAFPTQGQTGRVPHCRLWPQSELGSISSCGCNVRPTALQQRWRMDATGMNPAQMSARRPTGLRASRHHERRY